MIKGAMAGTSPNKSSPQREYRQECETDFSPDHSQSQGLKKTKRRGRVISIRWATASDPCTRLSEPTKYHVSKVWGIGVNFSDIATR
jgi:hypothetical protein